MRVTTKQDIIDELRKSVDKHQCSTQRYRQLKSVLGTQDRRLVSDALMTYWESLTHPDEDYEAQEFVAGLLLDLNPPPARSLNHLLRHLAQWNLSVDALPWYLAQHFGKDHILEELQRLEGSLLRNAAWCEAARTVRFWLRNYNPAVLPTD